MAIIAKNTTSSGVELIDLAGLTIEPYGESDLLEFFSMDKIVSSYYLENYVDQGILIINNGETDLSKEESLYHIDLETTYESVHRFTDLQDVTTTYSGNSGYLLRVNTTESGIEFVDYDDIASDFGSFVGDVSDDTESSTNSTTYIQKLSLSLNDLQAGRYRIGWYFEWSMSNSSFRFDAKVELDDSDTLGVLYTRPNCSYSWHDNSGFSYVNLTEGSHYIDLDYRSSHCSKSASIRRARLEIWRVS